MGNWADIATKSGLRRRIRIEEHDGKLVEVQQMSQPNIKATLDHNAEWYNAHSHKSRRTPVGEGKVGWTKVATVPFHLIEQWRYLGIANWHDPNDRPKIMAMLNSNEYLKLRTAPGIIPERDTLEY